MCVSVCVFDCVRQVCVCVSRCASVESVCVYQCGLNVSVWSQCVLVCQCGVSMSVWSHCQCGLFQCGVSVLVYQCEVSVESVYVSVWTQCFSVESVC